MVKFILLYLRSIAKQVILTDINRNPSKFLNEFLEGIEARPILIC